MKQCKILNITKSYGEKNLFQDLSFTITDSDKIGLIGVNGTGKSTLMKLITGVEYPDEGIIERPKNYTIKLLDQEPELNGELTIMETIFESDAEITKLMNQYTAIMKKYELKPESAEIQSEMLSIQQRMDEENAWDAASKAKSVLSKLGIQNTEMKLKQLSGGQKKRVALAQVLLEEPDLLLLDEPTNHLDYEAILWLGQYLQKYPGSLLFVSHDRYFIDQVSNSMLEIDKGKAYKYKGNYQRFIEAKAEREDQEASEERKKTNLYKNELAWMRKGAKARTTKQKARIQRFENLETSMSKEDDNELNIGALSSRLGKQVIELKNVSKKYDRVLFENFSLLVIPGDRIGIAGSNGSGKSTLMNMIAGRVKPDSGSVEIGQTVKIAYFSQEIEEIDQQLRMIEYIRESAEVVETAEGTISASQMLEQFLFPPESHGTPIYKLSGGEKRRLYLLKLLMKQPNVLMLDEPTNDLDTQTLTVLENFLDIFGGVVITVSHDRYFLDKVTDKLIIFKESGPPEVTLDDYSTYLEKQLNLPADEPVKNPLKEQNTAETKKEKTRLSYKEKLEWEEITSSIENIEGKIEALEQELNETGSDFVRAEEINAELVSLNDKLEELIERWSYLSEFAE
ncbi:ABC-F family ATP-binding cassette domain-containing protein [Jeotgalibacillus salarius]|uniref:ABC transporter ATP-binding protein n=1 Tax=Jeotgalibacillus salarius TaxID=546023 RepID=A0A4Y8LJ55_9BACL|nr:ABC-F family ATP-binding cassette domain-containing protein [Jeotgalibacillus salarius]TFE03026.1 ABC transporter ATP-binding protein [Jeotgalibacillus salarius]